MRENLIKQFLNSEIVINTKTEDEARQVLQLCINNNICWISDEEINVNETYFHIHKIETVYEIIEGEGLDYRIIKDDEEIALASDIFDNSRCMEKLSIEVSNGIIDTTAYVYDSDRNKICEATGSNEYEAIEKVALKLSKEIINIKANKKRIDELKKLEAGTKLKYRCYDGYRYGYYVRVNKKNGTVMVSKLKEDDKFSGLSSSDSRICRKLDPKDYEIKTKLKRWLQWVKIKL